MISLNIYSYIYIYYNYYTNLGGCNMNPTQIIIPLDKRVGWLRARKLTKDKGGLPSNVLHDNYLVRTQNGKQISEFYPLWAKELLVYPRINGKFKKGRDIIDSEIRWVIPWSEITRLISPESLIGSKVGLFVDPEDVTVDNRRKIVHPKSAKLLTNFIQEREAVGKVDEETRVPLEVEPGILENLPDEEKRKLARTKGVGVRPIVRYSGRFGFDDKQDVSVCGGPSGTCVGAAFEISISSSEDYIIKLLKEATDELKEVVQMKRPEKLIAVRKLLQALDIEG
jgi:hypothetical protein